MLHELVNFAAYFPADVFGQRIGGVFEADDPFFLRHRAVVEETALPVPDQRTVARVRPVAELKQGELALRLPDEQIEVIVVEPAPLRGWVVGDSDDFLKHALARYSRAHCARGAPR